MRSANGLGYSPLSACRSQLRIAMLLSATFSSKIDPSVRTVMRPQFPSPPPAIRPLVCPALFFNASFFMLFFPLVALKPLSLLPDTFQFHNGAPKSEVFCAEPLAQILGARF